MTLKPIQKQSVSDAAFEQLRSAILTGELPPGTEMQTERKLAETLQVNRGAIREALKRLEQSRLISIHHGGPTVVLDFRTTARLDLISELMHEPSGAIDLKVARSMMELRAAITPDLARLAALRGGADIGPTLKDVVEQMRTAGDDVSTLHELADQFWRAAAEASGNIAYRLLYNTIEDFHGQCQDAMGPILAERYRDFALWQLMADAIGEGDGDAAHTAATQHADGIAAAFYKSLAGRID